MANPGINPSIQMLASMLELEKTKAQNRAAAQQLAGQIQNMQAQAQARQLQVQAQQHQRAIDNLPVWKPGLGTMSGGSSMPEWKPGMGSTPGGVAPQIVAPTKEASSSSSTSAVPGDAADTTARAQPEPEEPEVPHCHLHRKANKACKFCKAHNEYIERKNKKLEERKKAAIERMKVGSSAQPIKVLGDEDTLPLPGLSSFPSYMLERIEKNDFFRLTLNQFELRDVTELLTSCDTCDTEVRDQNSLSMEPSKFVCAVYRLMNLQLTEGQLQMLLNARSCWIRCAGCLFVRLGVQCERYWELLSHTLLDDEEFVPYPGRDNESTTVGQFVEGLLSKDKYCNMALPRIPTAAKKLIQKRLVLYGQFRQRYAANQDVVERYRKAQEDVEICSMDGEWSKGKTVGSTSSGRRCVTTRVRFEGGAEMSVSLGMVIMPNSRGDRVDVEDLTRVRGRSSQDLMDELLQQQRDGAVARGKNYHRGSGEMVMRAGGIPFVAGAKRKGVEKESDSEDEAYRREMKKNRPSLEQQAQKAAIEAKYCARVSNSQGGRGGETLGPDRMRLG